MSNRPGMAPVVVFTSSDLIASLVIGEVLVWSGLAVARAIDLPLPLGNYRLPLAVFFPLACAAGLYGVFRLGRALPVFYQGAKFSLVGLLNTAVDFGVLNLLMLASGISQGIGYTVFKTLSFVLAVGNSFVWNKWWTFRAPEVKSAPREFLRFLLVSVAATGVNVAAATLVVETPVVPAGISALRWANLGAVVGTLAAALFNFLGYRYFVFRPKLHSQ